MCLVPLRFSQIHPISLRFAQSHSDPPNLRLKPCSDLLGLFQIHSDSCSLTQICSGSCSSNQGLTQIHSDSLRSMQNPSQYFSCNKNHAADSPRCTQTHSDLLSSHPSSFLTQIQSTRLVFTETLSDPLFNQFQSDSLSPSQTC